MTDQTVIKEQVRTKYDEIARQGEKAGCGCGCSSDISMIGDDYDGVEGYLEGADLGLGCGMPTELAGLEPGQTVLDLGSGAGLDVFIARRVVGDTGRVIGVDMTESMVEKALKNASDLGYDNVDFLLGEIEDLPVESDSVDVVISNCVLNLVPDKRAAFAEMYRVIRPEGHFAVSDVVVKGEMPPSIQRSAELYAGCVGGAIALDDYVSLLEEAGFQDVEIATAREIEVPEAILRDAALADDVEAFKAQGGLFSVTVLGRKVAEA